MAGVGRVWSHLNCANNSGTPRGFPAGIRNHSELIAVSLDKLAGTGVAEFTLHMPFGAEPGGNYRFDSWQTLQVAAITDARYRGFADPDQVADAFDEIWTTLGVCPTVYLGYYGNTPGVHSLNPFSLYTYARQSIYPALFWSRRSGHDVPTIVMDAVHGDKASDTGWKIRRALQAAGVTKVGHEPTGKMLRTTDPPISTPWWADPEGVGFITDQLWAVRIEADLAGMVANPAAWHVPLGQYVGEYVIFVDQAANQNLTWVTDRMAEGYSVSLQPGTIGANGWTAAYLTAVAESKKP